MQQINNQTEIPIRLCLVCYMPRGTEEHPLQMCGGYDPRQAHSEMYKTRWQKWQESESVNRIVLFTAIFLGALITIGGFWMANEAGKQLPQQIQGRR